MVAYPPTCAPGSPEQIEEERRVLGVAMTRAKLHLHLIEPPPGIAAESPRFDCGNLLWLENELSPFRVKDHYAGCLHWKGPSAMLILLALRRTAFEI